MGLEDGLRNIAVLSQREQELTERYKADHERSSALADVTSRKRERLELHTLSKPACQLLRNEIAPIVWQCDAFAVSYSIS
ncbi:hypothetical protein V5799_029656 [Amblyomma americanum]|uniref:Uncharacterized protein n=1 Tax=Amblyomma americanum TaxID=6943 RepID=A0AAQ4EQF5_AMBAM